LVSLPWVGEPVPFKFGDPFNDNDHNLRLVETLERNRAGFKKCRDSCVVILGLRRRPGFSQNKDIVGLIALLVWEERFSRVWTDPDYRSD
jgi:hypothetical protein